MDMREKIMQALIDQDECYINSNSVGAIANTLIAALRDQEPVSYRYKFISPMDGETPVWRDSPNTWNGQYPQESCPLYALPIPPVEQADSAFLSKHSLREALRQIETQTVEPRCAAIARAALFGQQPVEKS